MRIKDLTTYLESVFPLSTQESYDNSGLLVGNSEKEISAVLIALDCVESIIDEAISKKCEIVVVHHPIIFKGLKSLTGKNYIERTILKAIKNDIAIYAAHTNLDNFKFGVNSEIGKRLGIPFPKVLAPKTNSLSKLSIKVPIESSEVVLKAIFDAGGGEIGNYSCCSFTNEGIGSFTPLENAHPTLGEINSLQKVQENKIEVLVNNSRIQHVVQSMISAHPYEEVAYEIVAIMNSNQDEGAGMYGELPEAISEMEFLTKLKKTFNCGIIRHTKLKDKPIKKVAWCGGSGSFLLNEAKKIKADIFITGDFKYHEFFDAEEQILIADIGHYESEQFTTNLLGDIITKKFPKFALHLTGINTNPIKYF
ncbi:MAG: Nif3-like dinuclear metal center hexameric protein [Bacteroidetes bacterium]|nr:Nif3-like dinuclear metal center hexameric protein [Bacteroidota bacterium]